MWPFCVHLEATAVLHRPSMMRVTKVIELAAAHYIFATGVARSFGCAHWVIQGRCYEVQRLRINEHIEPMRNHGTVETAAKLNHSNAYWVPHQCLSFCQPDAGPVRGPLTLDFQSGAIRHPTSVDVSQGDGCPNLVMDDVVDTQDFHHTNVTTEIEHNQQAQGFIQSVRLCVRQHTSKHSLEYENMENSSATAAPVSNGSVTHKRQAPSAQQNNQRERRKARGGAHNVSRYVMPRNLQPTLGNSSGLSGEGLTYSHNEYGNLASFIRINDFE
ncbi:ER lumen protein retaining receptor [Artemisia annua]|uniref:ER lumen protein retaining receptor n=1 Tax=Artemisia annua TaxID=35608 RepID=A0A2U1KYZ5_ARTAN|nr:ER lumen protein retaining receptor [Artemisia annua]